MATSEPEGFQQPFDEKDEESNKSSPRDEEAGLPSEKEDGDAEAAAESAEEKPPPVASNDPGPPPNGGAKAWMQVLGSWMLFFNTWGILNTFGIYQTYYESGQLWTASSSNISWIGSIQALMVLLVGLFTGPIFDRGYLRLLLIIGTLGVVVGHMLLSLCKTYWETLLAQGFFIGIGAGFLYVPSIAIMPTWFSSKLGLAIGLAASGSSTGGIIYPIVFYKLIDQVGYGWSVRIIGFIALATLLIPIVVLKMRVKPGRVRSMIDWTAFTDWPYMLFTLGCILGFIGLYTGFFYTSYYGQANHITDASLSFYLVPILNAGSVFGRTLPNWLSDKVGVFNIITPGALAVGIILLCYIPANSVGGLVVCALLFGFFSGIFIALPPVIFVRLTKDKSKIGTRIGMGFAMLGAGVLAGGPGAGGILGTNEKNLHWTSTWIYGGVTCLAAGAIFTAMRVTKGGFKIQKV